jgi:hypothetical protein
MQALNPNPSENQDGTEGSIRALVLVAANVSLRLKSHPFATTFRASEQPTLGTHLVVGLGSQFRLFRG